MTEICEDEPRRKKIRHEDWRRNGSDPVIVATPTFEESILIVKHSVEYAAIVTHNALNGMRWGA